MDNIFVLQKLMSMHTNHHWCFFMFEFQRECGLRVIEELVEGDKNLSRIYGFILYTDKDPYVAKVLRDDDFWDALNDISGSNWPIFAARPLQKGIYKHSCVSGGIGYMVQAWEEPKDNLPIINDFGLQDSRELPLFVVFMWDDEDRIHEIFINIRGNDIDSVYSSLKEIVKAIAKVEDDVLTEYKGTVNVFRNVKSELESLKLKHKVIEIVRPLEKIFPFLSVFK